MIIVEKCYSYSSGQMIEKLIDKLDRDGVEDYEVVNKPPTDVISIVPEQSKIKIYIPSDMDYSQYEIDDYLRKEERFIRTNTENISRDLMEMTLNGTLQFNQIYKLINYIIDNEGFCSLIAE
jgi:hypothetical protein